MSLLRPFSFLDYYDSLNDIEKVFLKYEKPFPLVKTKESCFEISLPGLCREDVSLVFDGNKFELSILKENEWVSLKKINLVPVDNEVFDSFSFENGILKIFTKRIKKQEERIKII